MLCQLSQAVTVSLKAVPAVCSAGVVTLKLTAPAPLTVKAAEAPSIAPSLTLSVGAWASYSLICEAVPTPSLNVTLVAEAGYSGAVPLGALAGPLQMSVFEPA